MILQGKKYFYTCSPFIQHRSLARTEEYWQKVMKQNFSLHLSSVIISYRDFLPTKAFAGIHRIMCQILALVKRVKLFGPI